jgi:hypothetical protein
MLECKDAEYENSYNEDILKKKHREIKTCD